MSFIILASAILSSWVYTPDTKDIPMGIFKPIVVSPRVSLFETESLCIAAYRGTDSIQDLFEDLVSQTFQKCDFEFGVLKAFKVSFDEIGLETHNAMSYEIKEGRCKSKTIYFTGHSLGSAMALIAPTAYGIDEYEKIITFGGPKVCCGGNNNIINSNSILRMVNEKDPIPALPEPFEVQSLRHCGSHAVSLPSEKEIDDFEWPGLIQNYNLLDHRIQEYIKNIRRYINDLRTGRMFETKT